MPNLKDFTDPTECHVIGGPLGVGKTTTIVDALRSRAGHERVAVITNDFGPMGIDGAVIEGSLGGDGPDHEVDITTLPNGCVCCTAAIGFADTMRELAGLDRLDRILVEPSGVAMLGQVIDLLRGLTTKYALKLMPTIVVFDVKVASQPARALEMPIFSNRIEAADIMVANRCDLVDEAEVEKFREWSANLYPAPLKVITTERGRLPADVFDWDYSDLGTTGDGSPRVAPVADLGCEDEHDHSDHHVHRHDGHTHDGFEADGCMWAPEFQFVRETLESRVSDLLGGGLSGVRPARFKGVFHTDRGWFLCSYANGAVEFTASHYRRDSRVDWIVSTDHGGKLDGESVRSWLEEALVTLDR